MNRCLILTVWLLAVTVVYGQGQVTGYVGSGPAPAVQTGVPVTIAFERKTLQTLADGTHISRTTHEWFYRDSQGRTRMEYELNSPSGMPQALRTNIIVNDTVAGQTISWNTAQNAPKLYTVTQFGRNLDPSAANPGLRPAPVTPMPVTPMMTAALPSSPPQQPVMRPTTNRENLGTQDVHGAPCEATRTTTVYPVDMLGNDRPITVVREFCMSRQLGRNLSEHQDDPRTGLMTLTVTSLSRTDPDPALFQPPPDYTERPQPPSVPR